MLPDPDECPNTDGSFSVMKSVEIEAVYGTVDHRSSFEGAYHLYALPPDVVDTDRHTSPPSVIKTETSTAYTADAECRNSACGRAVRPYVRRRLLAAGFRRIVSFNVYNIQLPE